MKDKDTDLLDGDGGFPRFLLIENGETDSTRGVNVGVE